MFGFGLKAENKALKERCKFLADLLHKESDLKEEYCIKAMLLEMKLEQVQKELDQYQKKRRKVIPLMRRVK